VACFDQFRKKKDLIWNWPVLAGLEVFTKLFLHKATIVNVVEE